jgi:hypothetical protein
MKYKENKLGRYRKGVGCLTSVETKNLPTKIKYMRARYEGTCCSCGKTIEVNQYMRYNPELKKIKHAGCK